MKKTLLTSAIALSIFANAQVQKNNDVSPSISSGINKVLPAPQATFWTNDFSNTTTWTKTASSGPGLWTIGTTGAVGAYSITAINSTTKANGFAIFDSDDDCSGNQVANLTTATPIVCTGHPFIILQFEQQYRRFYDSTFVFVSNNAGTTWIKYVVNQAVANNGFSSANPELVKLNISATAGNQAAVLVRFQFYSPSSIGASAGCGYSWMVDDAALIDIPANDIKIDNGLGDFSYKNGGFYTMMPKTQVMPISFRAAVSNVGTAAQTNVKLNINISNGTSSVYNQTSTAIPSIPYLGKDTLSILTPTFMPSSTQTLTYTVTYSITQTQTELAPELLNSVQNRTIIVNDTVFARDNNIVSDVASPNYFTTGTSGSEIALLYEFPVKATASSISAYVDAISTNGTSLAANIYKLGLDGNIDLIATSAITHSISGASAKGKWITFPISAVLDKDSSYLASIVTIDVSPSTPIARVILGADKNTQQPSGTSFIFLNGGTTPTWFLNDDLPMIRLNIKPGYVGLNELEKNGFELSQNVPNPFSKNSTVSYNLIKEASNASFTITDVMGRVVSSEKVANTVGYHTIKVGSYASGVYYYSLTIDGKSITKKMIVE
jgi:Secretion system C-terminal sorting domain